MTCRQLAALRMKKERNKIYELNTHRSHWCRYVPAGTVSGKCPGEF